MSIIGQNALLNQYVPTIFIKDLLDGQILRYDAARRAFVNTNGGGSGPGANKLGELLNVSPTVDSPSLSLTNGQALVYNSFTSLWENAFIDYNTLLNKPTIGTGSVTSVNVSGGTTGLTTTGGPVTTSGVITLSGTLSIANGGTGATTATGAINALLPSQTGQSGRFLTTNGTNITWADVPDGSLTLTGDISGTGTGTVVTTLATVNLAPGVYGDDHFVPTITVNNKGLVTLITTQHVDTTVRDLVPLNETFIVDPRHQYIVMSQLEVDGLMINNGVIAIL